MTPRPDVLEITTTSVGRATVRRAYESFFTHATYSGQYRVVVVVDPAYGVPQDEFDATVEYLRELPERHPQVRESVVEVLPHAVGLQTALTMLFAHARAEVGVHLEDDWEMSGPVELDGLIADLYAQDSTAIVLGNSHAGRGGSFDDPELVEPVAGTNTELLRLKPAHWAAHYLPLCPHLHRTARWAPAISRALALTDTVRCPDERVRERLIAERATGAHNVLWTKNVVAHDIGRSWLRQRDRFKAITVDHAPTLLPQDPIGRSGGALPLTRSHHMLERADDLIPGGTQTFQKRPENFAPGDYPVYAERGAGAMLWDVDGTGYVDFVLALGAASLGHAHPAITNVVRERVGRGVLHSLPAEAELTAAAALAGAVSSVERVRFLKTGADTCSAAVRLARFRTGRERILLAGYHGWHDHFGHSDGVPAAVSSLTTRLNLDHATDDAHFVTRLRGEGHQLAAVVVSTPYHRTLNAEFLAEVREACDETGALLVLDEIVTGFRLAPGGLSESLGVRPDVLCFSKGLAAGMPLSAIAGPAEVLDDLGKLRISTTFGGELLSLEALKVALREYSARDGDYYRRIAELGARLREGLNAQAAHVGMGAIATGYDAMPCLRFSDDSAEHVELAERFLGGMARRGYLLRRDVNFVSAVHSAEQIDGAVAAAGEVLPALGKAGMR